MFGEFEVEVPYAGIDQEDGETIILRPFGLGLSGDVSVMFMNTFERCELVFSRREAKRVAECFDSVFFGSTESVFVAGVLLAHAGYSEYGIAQVLIVSDDLHNPLCARIECGPVFSSALRNVASYSIYGFLEEDED